MTLIRKPIGATFVCTFKRAFDLEMELRSRDGASISRSNLDLEMELRSRDGSFDLEIELRSRDGSFDLEIELRSRDGSFDLEMECRYRIIINNICTDKDGCDKRGCKYVICFIFVYHFAILSILLLGEWKTF